jgi:hypothetical protein
MANYKELEGFGVQTLAADPDTPGWVGSIFYNSTEGVFKTVKPGGIAPAGTWASVTSLNTARGQLTGDGTVNAAFAVCGSTTVAVGNFELYNGSSWTETTDVNTARRNAASFGTQTSALVINGQPGGVVEQWNGSAWTEVAEMNTSRIGISMTGCGVSGTSGMQGGGFANPSPPTGATETWNGTSWTEVNDMNTARQQHGQNGTQTAAINCWWRTWKFKCG